MLSQKCTVFIVPPYTFTPFLCFIDCFIAQFCYVQRYIPSFNILCMCVYLCGFDGSWDKKSSRAGIKHVEAVGCWAAFNIGSIL